MRELPGKKIAVMLTNREHSRNHNWWVEPFKAKAKTRKWSIQEIIMGCVPIKRAGGRSELKRARHVWLERCRV